jgi:hypothetical protein
VGDDEARDGERRERGTPTRERSCMTRAVSLRQFTPCRKRRIGIRWATNRLTRACSSRVWCSFWTSNSPRLTECFLEDEHVTSRA